MSIVEASGHFQELALQSEAVLTQLNESFHKLILPLINTGHEVYNWYLGAAPELIPKITDINVSKGFGDSSERFLLAIGKIVLGAVIGGGALRWFSAGFSEESRSLLTIAGALTGGLTFGVLDLRQE